MGDYCSLRFAAQLTDDGLVAVRRLGQADTETARGHSWSNVPGFGAYAAMGRSNFIPFGALNYAPKGWVHANRLQGGLWVVCCSIKRAAKERDVFLETVLPALIADRCEVEVWDAGLRELSTVVVLPALRPEEEPTSPGDAA